MAAGPSTSFEEALSLLRKNPPGVTMRCSETLFAICKKATTLDEERQPVLGSAKYRRLRKDSPTFVATVANAKGGVRFIRAAGFVTDPTGDFFILQDDADPARVRRGMVLLKDVAKEAKAAVEEERARENELAAKKLALLKRVQEDNSSKRSAEEHAERERIRRAIAAQRFEEARQADPTNFR